MSKVVITGLGAITPIGNDVPTSWENLKNGVSGADKMARFDAVDHPTKVSCEIKDFNPNGYMDRKVARRLALSTQYSIVAAKQALEDANFTVTDDNCTRVGVAINTGGGGLDMVEDAAHLLAEKGPRSASPFLVPTIMANAASCLVSIETGAGGPILTSTLACASGNYAFIEAFHFLNRGEADVMITGGVEGGISPLIAGALARMQATSTRNDDPIRASRPFDGDRDGFVQGEGGIVMILETEEHAKARNAKIYAEVLGGALTGDAYHITAPHPDGWGATRAMRNAIKNAGISVDDVDVIYAHGTSTPLNDAAETKVIKSVFGERAYQIPISATKSMVGHMLGGAGSISTLAAVMAFNTGIIPPTINHTTPDPVCDLDYVPNEARKLQTNVALINAFGFGGQNVVLVVKRYQTNHN